MWDEGRDANRAGPPDGSRVATLMDLGPGCKKGRDPFSKVAKSSPEGDEAAL